MAYCDYLEISKERCERYKFLLKTLKDTLREMQPEHLENCIVRPVLRQHLFSDPEKYYNQLNIQEALNILRQQPIASMK